MMMSFTQMPDGGDDVNRDIDIRRSHIIFLIHVLHPGSVDELHKIFSDFQRRVQEKENTLRNVSTLFDLSIPPLAAARLFQRLSNPRFLEFRGSQESFWPIRAQGTLSSTRVSPSLLQNIIQVNPA